MVLRVLLWGFLFWTAMSFQSSWLYYVTLRNLNIDITFALLFYFALTYKNKNAMVFIGFVIGFLTDTLWSALIGTNALIYAIIMLYITNTIQNIDELYISQVLKISSTSVFIKVVLSLFIAHFILEYKPSAFELAKDIFFNLIVLIGIGMWAIYRTQSSRE